MGLLELVKRSKLWLHRLAHDLIDVKLDTEDLEVAVDGGQLLAEAIQKSLFTTTGACGQLGRWST
jgi:hypothetical protein